MAAATTVIAGAAIGGAVLGGMKAAKGTPAQQQFTTKNIQGPSAEEQRLRELSMQQYQQQLAQLQQQEQALNQVGGLREQAIGGYSDVLSGQAFQATPQELAQIERIRQAQIGMGQQDIQNFLNQAQAQTSRSAGVRNLRGQALAELQGRNVQAGAEQFGRLVNTAGLQAAQSAQQLPFQRVGAQQNALQQGLTYQDLLRQQAVQNRQQAQNPALMGALQNERMALIGEERFIPGKKADWIDVAGGVLGGAGAGANLGSGLNSAFGGASAGANPNLRQG